MKGHSADLLSHWLHRIRPIAGQSRRSNSQVRAGFKWGRGMIISNQCDRKKSLSGSRDNSKTPMAFPGGVIK